MFLLADKKPLPAAETRILDAAGEARYCWKAAAAGFLVKATAKSPAASTSAGELLIDGNTKNLATLPTGEGSLSLVMVVATKLASYTIAEDGLALNTLSTEPVKGTFTALAREPTRDESPQISLRSLSAVVTVGSVHGIWWWVSLL